jgi:lambda family phage minor tail protein L
MDISDSTTGLIQADIQSLSPSALMELYVLDVSSLTGVANNYMYFHAGTNQLSGNVVWQGKTYIALPIESEGFASGTTGALPRPKIRLANVDGAFSATVSQFDDLIGAKISRKRTFVKYLDEVNFIKTNLLKYSEDFTQANWAKSAGTTVVGNSLLSPDGTVDADTLSRSALSNTYLVQTYTTTSHASNTYTFSVYVKAGTLTGTIQLRIRDGGGVTDIATTTLTPTSAWARYSVTGTFGATPLANINVYIDPANNTGVIGDTVYIWGAQLELGSTASTYEKVGVSWNTTADPNQHYPDDVWFIDQKMSETRYMIEWELASAFDLMGVMLPSRQIHQNSCPWKYAGAECGYNPNAVGAKLFNAVDTQVYTLASDVCGKRLTSCEARFGTTAVLPYGGFPGSMQYG